MTEPMPIPSINPEQNQPSLEVVPSPKKSCCKPVIWLGIGVIILAIIVPVFFLTKKDTLCLQDSDCTAYNVDCSCVALRKGIIVPDKGCMLMIVPPSYCKETPICHNYQCQFPSLANKSTSPKSTSMPTQTGQLNPTASSSYNPNLNRDTTNWKTYTNEKYGYLIKYPMDWNVSCAYPNCDSASMIYAMSQTVKDNKFSLTIGVKPKSEIVTPKEAFTSVVASEIISQQETIVDGIPAYEGSVMQGLAEIGPFLNQLVLVIKNDYIYQITFSEKMEIGSDKTSHQQRSFDQILSTFKFTE